MMPLFTPHQDPHSCTSTPDIFPILYLFVYFLDPKGIITKNILLL